MDLQPTAYEFVTTVSGPNLDQPFSGRRYTLTINVAVITDQGSIVRTHTHDYGVVPPPPGLEYRWSDIEPGFVACAQFVQAVQQLPGFVGWDGKYPPTGYGKRRLDITNDRC